MEQFTPSGLKWAITVKELKLKELRKQRAETAHRKQSDHPRYAQMTPTEFHEYKLKCIRESLDRSKRLQEEIDQLKTRYNS